MPKRPAPYTPQLFYSYSHTDADHRDSMETQLSLLKREGLLDSWSDNEILPGSPIAAEIDPALQAAEIVVFLLSPAFIDSEACMGEWERVRNMAKTKSIFRIPVIVSHCPWLDLLGNDDVKALPNDGHPISSFEDPTAAWQEVYTGIKRVVEHLHQTFTPRVGFVRDLNKTDFLSQDHILLDDLFVFPRLSQQLVRTSRVTETLIDNRDQLLQESLILIKGPELSGKTALAKHLFLHLLGDDATSPLYVDLRQARPRSSEKFLADVYGTQYTGNYDLWKQQEHKTLLIDNMSSSRRAIDFVSFAQDHFQRIVVTVTSDIYASYLRDDKHFARFCTFSIEPLSRVQQERLIRRHANLSHGGRHLPDGLVDRIENQVNAVVVSDKILPRYPFFVLSILQTFEAYMPESFTVSSYGHCYTALIIATLIKAGIRNRDQDLNPCFNFAERLAFEIWRHRQRSATDGPEFDFNVFVRRYREEFVIPDGTVNRMRHDRYGILNHDGRFKVDYVYYFFLGMFLAKDREEHRQTIEDMCSATYIPENYLTLMFVIHHTDSADVIDNILLQTLGTLESVEPARLERDETRVFDALLRKVPRRVVKRGEVDEERKRVRERQDAADADVENEEDGGDEDEVAREFGNACYTVMKNNEIMGQIIRNQYGMLKRERLAEIVEIVCDGGLRLVKPILISEEELEELAEFVGEKFPEEDVDGVTRLVRLFTFIWAVMNVEKLVETINVPEIREIVEEVVGRGDSAAYDLIGYFYLIDSREELTKETVGRLRELLGKHGENSFVRWVLSIRTQQYLNTHRSDHAIEHGVMDLLDIPRRMRERRLGREGRRLRKPKGR